MLSPIIANHDQFWKCSLIVFHCLSSLLAKLYSLEASFSDNSLKRCFSCRQATVDYPFNRNLQFTFTFNSAHRLPINLADSYATFALLDVLSYKNVFGRFKHFLLIGIHKLIGNWASSCKEMYCNWSIFSCSQVAHYSLYRNCYIGVYCSYVAS